MALAPGVPFAPPSRVVSRPRTAPGTTFHLVPSRQVRLDPSESVKPAYGGHETARTRHAKPVPEGGA